MPGVKGKSGGRRPGAGRKPTKGTKSIELSGAATRDLRSFMDGIVTVIGGRLRQVEPVRYWRHEDKRCSPILQTSSLSC